MENLTFPLYRPSFLFYLVCTLCTPMLMKICTALDCQVADIVEIIPDTSSFEK
ncbi:XRE family transcriptional regulator [Anaerotruncus colihominis]|uniref:XRE family transcriptional regulator n=1 Tax=Anaerotruncus colihominis TaxID=169435 RepID=A0A3E3IE94_9FIRM|nr:XRE family transcriptional regulator [Anaerotruncus colihominis]